EIEAGRLACTIGTDERVDGPATNVKADAIDGSEPRKGFGQSDRLQNVVLAHWIAVSTSMLDQRAVALVERSPSFLGGNGRKLFIVVPLALALLGFLTSNRYMGWILRPSSRTLPWPISLSSVGSSFILAITALPSPWLPSASTARR